MLSNPSLTLFLVSIGKIFVMKYSFSIDVKEKLHVHSYLNILLIYDTFLFSSLEHRSGWAFGYLNVECALFVINNYLVATLLVSILVQSKWNLIRIIFLMKSQITFSILVQSKWNLIRIIFFMKSRITLGQKLGH